MLGIGKRGGGDDRRSDRIAGHARFSLIDALQPRKAASDSVDAWAQKAIRASHHRILLMQDGRNPEEPRGEKRRHRRISAKANDRARLDAVELDGGGREARAKRE